TVSVFCPTTRWTSLALVVLSASLLVISDAPARAESAARQSSDSGFSVSESGARALEVRAQAAEPKAIVVPFNVASEDAKKPDDKDAEALPLPTPTTPQLSPAQQYCSSILDTATAAQIAQQTRNLEKAQKQLDDRIALLAAKAEILKGWIKLRED